MRLHDLVVSRRHATGFTDPLDSYELYGRTPWEMKSTSKR